MAKRLKSLNGTVNRTVPVTGALFFILCITAFFTLRSYIAHQAPTIAGYKLMVVLSGSMKPVFNTGAVVVVKMTDPALMGVGDIITFKDPEDETKIITHRVVGMVEGERDREFVTKGDANAQNDLLPVPLKNVLGQVVFSVPYFGFLIAWIQANPRFFFIILTLIVLIVIDEIRVSVRNQEKLAKQRQKPAV